MYRLHHCLFLVALSASLASAREIDALGDWGVNISSTDSGGVAVDISFETSVIGPFGETKITKNVPITSDLIVAIRSIENLESITIRRPSTDALEPIHKLLAALLHAKNLRHVAVTHIGANDETARLVAQNRGLTRVSLNNCRQVTNLGLRHLTNADEIRDLDLTSTTIDDEGLRSLRQLPNLVELDLSFTDVQGPGLLYLRDLTNLESLTLSANRSTAETSVMDLSAFRSGFPALKSVSFAANKITNQHLADLANCRNLEVLNLETLGLSEITDDGLDHLAALARLKKLSLDGSPKLTDVGASKIALLQELEYLNLDRTKITAASAPLFAKMPSLKELSIVHTPFARDPRLASILSRLNARNTDLEISTIRPMHHD